MENIYQKKEKFYNFIKKNHFLNVGTGKDLSIKQYANIIKKIINPKAKIKFNRKYPDGTPRKLLNINNFESLGWKSKTNLYDGVKKTFHWAKQHKKI